MEPPQTRATHPKLGAIAPVNTEHLARLRAAHDPFHQRLEHHAVFGRLVDESSLRAFTELHVYAVWDFMSLIKSLQGSLTGNLVPWVPSRDYEATRLVNAIVLAEECDRRQEGVGYASHFQLYREAMVRIGAKTAAVDQFVRELQAGTRWQRALQNAEIPVAAERFIRHTLRTAEMAEPHQVAAAFLFGREAVLSTRFRPDLERLQRDRNIDTSGLLFYLERHMEVNRHQHASASERLVAVLCGEDDARWRQAEKTAKDCLEERLMLWDAVVKEIETRR